MKKRIVLLTLTLMMIVGTLAGCGDNNSPDSARSGLRNERNANVDDDDDDDDDNGDVKHIAKKYEKKLDNGYDSYSKNAMNYVTSDACAVEEEYYEAYDTAGTSDSYMSYEGDYDYQIPDFNTEEYSYIKENGFSKVSMSPLSTFSADVDTASYSNIRRFIDSGYGIGSIPTGSARTEEMLNYFSYNYDGPKKSEPFGVNAEISTCPWNEEHELLMLGLQTEAIDFSEAPDSNIVFLIDVSGSMYDENKLPLLKKSFELMVENLTEKDRVSIVTYASGDEIVLEGVPASDKETIIDALDSLEAGGSTNGARGIVAAYELAEDYFIKGGNNRVIIATDGDFNVGLTSESDLEKLIEEERENGIFLSVLGFGMGNYSDTRMETLADTGNGNYAYIDNLKEANKVLVEELGANMTVVAKDVKLQVEFNPAYVEEYRLIGYEDRKLADEDFDDDTKDAGEVGAGHSVTVIYEIVPRDGKVEKSGLKYQDTTITDEAKNSDEWLTLSIRYKDPDKKSSELLEYAIGNEYVTDDPSDDFKFASCVVAFSELIRESEYTGDMELDDIIDILDTVKLNDEYKEEFAVLVRMLERNSDY